MPGQCFLRPSSRRPNRSGSDVGFPASSRTWQCASVAPASKASCVDSTYSAIVIGTAGLSAFVGNDPVMATVMMQGVVIGPPLKFIGGLRAAFELMPVLQHPKMGCHQSVWSSRPSMSSPSGVPRSEGRRVLRDVGIAARSMFQSITSSARASSDGGISRPSAFAVLRLTTRSNLVGCWTGISAGFVPRRILSTCSAAWRKRSIQFGP